MEKSSVQYDGEHILGRGNFGVVFRTHLRETGEEVAIKRILQDRRYKVQRF
jgi:serine/threonine protein kinase